MDERSRGHMDNNQTAWPKRQDRVLAGLMHTALCVVLYGQKEGGSDGFQPRPHKRRRRALESHSKEVFNLSEKYLIDFNFFRFFFIFPPCLIISHRQSAPEAAMAGKLET